MKSRYSQSGYLMEIPIILFITAVLLGVLLPNLPDMAGKIVVIVVALIWIAGLYYMIVIPGWQPGAESPSRSGKVMRLILFIALAICILLVTGAYVFHRKQSVTDHNYLLRNSVVFDSLMQ
jgi:predicted membrane channel-forming protein YqfA (hemolysin III family)